MAIRLEEAAALGLLAFAAGVGVLTTVGLLLLLAQLVSTTATAVAGAVGGISITVAVRKGK